MSAPAETDASHPAPPERRENGSPAGLERMRCGVITSAAFREWLILWHTKEAAHNFGFVAQLDYVRCREGSLAGQSWVTVMWSPLKGMGEHEIYPIAGKIKIYLNKATRTALRDRCLDIRGGAIIVR